MVQENWLDVVPVLASQQEVFSLVVVVMMMTEVTILGLSQVLVTHPSPSPRHRHRRHIASYCSPQDAQPPKSILWKNAGPPCQECNSWFHC